MSERFLKFIPSEEAMWLMQKKPNAFFLLTHIANTARRTSGHPDGLLIGQCHLKAAEKYGFTIAEYRAAKNILVSRKHIIIIETNRTRQKSTTGTTTGSTLVQLCSTTVYDINPEANDNRNDHRTTTERQLNDNKQERIRRDKKEEDKEKEIKETLGASLLADFFSSLKSSYPAISEKKLLANKTQIQAMTRLLQMHSEEMIRAVFRFAHSNSFWVAYVHTACYLEKKFDTLNLQRLKPAGTQNEVAQRNAKSQQLERYRANNGEFGSSNTIDFSKDD